MSHALFALAGGTPPGAELWLTCCFESIAGPLVVVFAVVAVARRSARAAIWAIALAGLPCGLLVIVMAGYGPTDDSDIRMDQAQGHAILPEGLTLFGLAVLAAGLTIVRRKLAARARFEKSVEVERDVAAIEAAVRRGRERLDEMRRRGASE